jgi:alpha-galactosidase
MHDALNKTGHSIVFSMCEWGVQDPATWAPSVGNSWRTTGDINPSWNSWTKILDGNDKWWQQAGPGGWNDPDMLEVDNGKMTQAEQKAHFTMWCLIKAPLLLGMDLRNISPSGLEIISNTEVIQWNQDKLGVQGHRVYQERVETTSLSSLPSPLLRNRRLDGSIVQTTEEDELEGGDGFIEVWAGPLTDGKYAVVLFNRGSKQHIVTAHWNDIGIPSAQAMKARDVWQHKSIGTFASNYTAMVEPHDVIAIQLEPAFFAIME